MPKVFLLFALVIVTVYKRHIDFITSDILE